MKITVRIPTDKYAYQEVEFESMEEYESKYPEFIKVFSRTRKRVTEAKKELSEQTN